MARVALEQTMPAAWVDDVFEEHRQHQYPRELMSSTELDMGWICGLARMRRRRTAARIRQIACWGAMHDRRGELDFLGWIPKTLDSFAF